MNTLYKKLCGVLFVGLLTLTLSYSGFAAGPVESAGIEKNGAAKKGDSVIRILAIGNSFRRMLWNNIFTSCSMLPESR